MHNPVIKKTPNTSLNVQTENILTKEDLLETFRCGIKPLAEQKIGMEYERLPVYKSDFSAVPYFGEKGIQNLLLEFAKRNDWEQICDSSFVIALKKNGVQISLEPGAQVEISTKSHKNVSNIEAEITQVENKLDTLADEFGIKLLSYGVSPYNTWKNIHLIPKTRYHIMANMLSGYMAPVMMRETAGIQVAYDFYSEEDAIKKLKLALMLSPFATAIFANSPIRGGIQTDYQSYRASAWLNTDNNRCGLVSYKLFESTYINFNFEDYLDVVLNVPMLYIMRNDNFLKIQTPLTFKGFMEKGYEGYIATREDFDLHISLYFPEVRMRNYLEIRNHDSVPGLMKYAVPAFYKGILYSEKTSNDILEIFKEFSYVDFVYLRENVPKLGLNAKIGKYKMLDYAKEILALSYNSLYRNKDDDSKYLEQCINMVYQGKTFADLVIENKAQYLL